MTLCSGKFEQAGPLTHPIVTILSDAQPPCQEGHQSLLDTCACGVHKSVTQAAL